MLKSICKCFMTCSLSKGVDWGMSADFDILKRLGDSKNEDLQMTIPMLCNRKLKRI